MQSNVFPCAIVFSGPTVNMTSKEKLEERKFILECIELYETLPALWNTKCRDYSNREKKNQQYDTLLFKYKERFPNADKTELIKKFNSLRTNFRKELKKINDFGKSGAGADDINEPTLWYFDQMKFLTNISEPCSSQSRMCNDKDDVEGFLSKENPPKKKRKDDLDNLISLACRRLSQTKNEFDAIAKTWATDLSKMDYIQQLHAKKAIGEILYEGQMGTLNRNSVQINKAIHSSSTEYSNSGAFYCEPSLEEGN